MMEVQRLEALRESAEPSNVIQRPRLVPLEPPTPIGRCSDTNTCTYVGLRYLIGLSSALWCCRCTDADAAYEWNQ